MTQRPWESAYAMTILLHDFTLSGHAHRVRLMLSLLGIAYEARQVDLAGGAHKRPEFLDLNLFGQVPVLEIDGHAIADSSAILTYLALTRDPARTWLPADPLAQAQVQRWLSVAAGPLAHGPAAARIIRLFGRDAPIAPAQALARQLFDTMENWLEGRRFLVGNGPTIADVALYSYTARAPEGEIDLSPWPAIRAWLARVEALPGFHAIPHSR